MKRLNPPQAIACAGALVFLVLLWTRDWVVFSAFTVLIASWHVHQFETRKKRLVELESDIQRQKQELEDMSHKVSRCMNALALDPTMRKVLQAQTPPR